MNVDDIHQYSNHYNKNESDSFLLNTVTITWFIVKYVLQCTLFLIYYIAGAVDVHNLH